MKERITKLLLIILLMIPVSVFAENRITGEYGSYEDAQKIVKEIEKSFYIRGRNIQYNTSKKEFTYSPEEATSQDQKYIDRIMKY